MAKIRVNSILVKNYRSFGNEEQSFVFPGEAYNKPVAIVGYNNSGKTNLMNAIKFALCEPIREDTFELKDFHNCSWENPPMFQLDFSAEIVDDHIRSGSSYINNAEVLVDEDCLRIKSVVDICSCYSGSNKYSKKWVIKQKAPIYYLNFHVIKEQLSTQKTSWGNLKSFLAKHIKSLVNTDVTMAERQVTFKEEVKAATDRVLGGCIDFLETEPSEKTMLQLFIEAIKKNYRANLRNNDCVVDFGLPDYEDVFLQMMFKIGLNGDINNLIPISHFGDGFISMFVMAVIQAIAESNTDDKCLFLFEEPESFLHENHQEYFYKTVLCGLAENGHQIIYTTHSDRMIDIFDTEGLIRLEFDEELRQTVKKYNNTSPFSARVRLENGGQQEEIINLKHYNSFIRSVEPSLNKIIFSKKVVLVEGPNDLMVYKEAVRRKVLESAAGDDSVVNPFRYADTYLNFHNIAIIPHHGKITALLLMRLCHHLGVNFFVINDWDLQDDFVTVLSLIETEAEMKRSQTYLSSDKKGIITTNWKLIKIARDRQIHFNVPKLEMVIGYNLNDKSSIGIWNRLQDMGPSDFGRNLFPLALEEFLEITNDNISDEVIEDVELLDNDLPF